ncbi:type III-A CRISPR-associated RAMP protein Csm4 [Thermaurantiacus tibetensis]|uniref:type III-A CRISPR-associated RAMP protein Csm4 n=1 Tax=Thermaurantiacus tibetensis TaxID=2759035 RepID=UPI00188E7F19|nr:CRISPR-associated protein Csm7 [Thermaurantiacus tibetensis]
MRWLAVTLRPLSAFGTPLRGDTLFGQLCWALRHRLGEARLEELLDGYAGGRPFLVVSDAFPLGFLPRPELPPPPVDPLQRKTAKKGRFLAARLLAGPLPPFPAEGDVAEEPFAAAAQPHNSLSRLTGTTGEGFDPFQMERRWPFRWVERAAGKRVADVRLWVHLLLDEARLARSDLATALADVGAFGFGRDASIGLGRFAIEGWAEGRPVQAEGADAFLALAPSAHAPGSLDAGRSFHRPFVRFGRHGADAATGANPFKMPVLLMDTGAVLRPASFDPGALFLGRGLGGGGRLSKEAVPGTVHQGYAPVIPIVARWADAARSAA